MTLVSKEILSNFEATSLQTVGEDALLTRRDTKFVFNVSRLDNVLTMFSYEDWKILEVEGVRNQYYTSIYLDTPSLDCYNEHHNERANRNKYRFRKYQNGAGFFEIKTKTNKGITVKDRCTVSNEEFTEDLKVFANQITSIDSELLAKNIRVSYNRITLFNFETNEKVTIDTEVEITLNDKVFKNDRVVILELKQEQFNKNLDTKRLLQDLGLAETGLSKYCLGIVKCVEGVKTNRFKRKLRILEKIGKAS